MKVYQVFLIIFVMSEIGKSWSQKSIVNLNKINFKINYNTPASTGRTSAAVTAGLPINWCFFIESFANLLFFQPQDVVVIIELSD